MSQNTDRSGGQNQNNRADQDALKQGLNFAGPDSAHAGMSSQTLTLQTQYGQTKLDIYSDKIAVIIPLDGWNSSEKDLKDFNQAVARAVRDSENIVVDLSLSAFGLGKAKTEGIAAVANVYKQFLAKGRETHLVIDVASASFNALSTTKLDRLFKIHPSLGHALSVIRDVA